MPTAATMTAGATAQTTRGRNDKVTVLPVVPFIRASAEHREPAVDVSRQMTTSDQDLGVFDVPAYGYLRSIIIEVTTTGGAGTAVTALEDAPWNILKNIALTEPNGAAIAQFNSGYELYLANKYGGYRYGFYQDPKASPSYSLNVGAAANTTWLLRIPVEISQRDGLGALPNQNASATFKVRATLARIADVFGGTVGTAPTVRVRMYMEAWDQPEAQTAGQTNQVTPPAMNTTQFWSVQTYPANQGSASIRLTRMGNYVRNVIFVARRNGGSRVQGDADWPDPATLYLDTRPLDAVSKNVWRNQMYERYGYGQTLGSATNPAEAPQGLDNGVFVYDFTHEFDGKAGGENRDLWLPTLGSTRFEFQGNFGNADTVTVLTNDVAIAGTVFL